MMAIILKQKIINAYLGEIILLNGLEQWKDQYKVTYNINSNNNNYNKGTYKLENNRSPFIHFQKALLEVLTFFNSWVFDNVFKDGGGLSSSFGCLYGVECKSLAHVVVSSSDDMRYIVLLLLFIELLDCTNFGDFIEPLICYDVPVINLIILLRVRIVWRWRIDSCMQKVSVCRFDLVEFSCLWPPSVTAICQAASYQWVQEHNSSLQENIYAYLLKSFYAQRKSCAQS